MVQKRQLRQNHMDSHYCAAIFRYVHEYAVLFRDSSLFLCLDDKHRIKVGEPGTPVVAAERGKQVLVSISQSLQVCDLLRVDIPASMDGSWYDGQVFVGIKRICVRTIKCLETCF